MRGLYRFLKSTIVGGLVLLVPLAMLVTLVGWAVDLVVKFVGPLLAWLPDQSIGGVSLTVLVAFAALVATCFFAGLFAETTFIRGFSDRAEQLALVVPGYALMKSVGANLIGIESKRAVKTVLVRFEASWQLGFLMDTLADGRQVVFIPGVPRALVGTLHIVSADQVELLALSVSSALDALARLGVGLHETWPRLDADR